MQADTTQISQEVLTRLDALASRLGIVTEQLWEALLLQAKLEILDPIVLFVFGVMALIGFYFTFKHAKERYPSDDIPFVVGAIITGVATFFLLIVVAFPIELFEGIKAFINPEYWALNEILDVLGK